MRTHAFLILTLLCPAADWPASGPRVLWKRPVGAGFAGPVVADGRLLLFHRQGNREVLEALDPATGKPLWQWEQPTAYRDDFGFDEGPRAMPAVSGGRVFVYGAEGKLAAVDLATGRGLWNIDAMARYGVPKAFFGAAGTPVVIDGRVILNAGGRGGAGIVAFDAATGLELWKATNDEASYSSGVSTTLNGKPAVVFFTRNGLAALDPRTGAVLQQKRWRSRSNASVNAAAPLVWNDEIFLSASYGTGAALFKASGADWPVLWTGDDSLSNHYASSVRFGDFLYGFHGRQETGQELRCVEWKTGKVRWTQEGFGAGTLMLSGDRLLILKESGELILAPATPDGFRPLSRAKILAPTVRAYPALSEGRCFARNETGLIAVELTPPPSAPAPAPGKPAPRDSTRAAPGK